MQKVELRLLSGCENQMRALKSDFLYRFHLLNCSKLISTIVRRKYLGYSMLKSGAYLKEVNRSGQLTFFTQVLNFTRNSTSQHVILGVDALLYMITEAGEKVLLHKQPVNPRMIGSIVHHLGGTDIRKDAICWSTVSQVHCAKLDIANKNLSNVITVVKEGESESHRICGYGKNGTYWVNYIAGVGLASTSGQHYSVYFGCTTDEGAGLVRVKKDGTERFLYRVRSGNQTVFANGMFTVDDSIPSCPTNPPVTTSQRQTTKPSSSTGWKNLSSFHLLGYIFMVYIFLQL